MMRLWLICGIPMCLVLAFFATYRTGYVHGSDTIQAKWDAEKAAIVTAQRDKEAALQANMDNLRTEKNNELARLNRHVRALSDSLRDRPDRPAVPASTQIGDGAIGCTGATLYRSDSEFLIRFSERADTLRLALKACQEAYQAASGQ
jgi:hypothetical protein